MFSVVIPLYNKEKSIRSTLQSVLAQTFKDFEVVVVNDGSKDNSRVEVLTLNDSKIRLIDKENGGVSSARNLGIHESKFEWVALLDGDDLYHPHFLETIYSLLKKFPEAEVYFTGFGQVNDKTNFKSIHAIPGEGYLDDYFKAVNRVGKTVISSSSVVIKKSLLLEVGGFNTNLKRGEDLDLWERLAKRCKMAYTEKVLAFYRLDAENRTNVRLPELKSSRLYNLNVEEIKTEDEFQYYRPMVLNSIWTALRYGKFKRAFIFYWKYKKVITIGQILSYISNKFKNKN